MQTHNSRACRWVLFWRREQKNEFHGCQRRSDSCTNVVPFEGVSISYWMDSSCLRSITMFTGYFSTVTTKICWFTLKLNRSLKPYHCWNQSGIGWGDWEKYEILLPSFFRLPGYTVDSELVVTLGKWSGTGGRRKNGGMWVERWKEMGNSTTILNISKG